MSVFKIKLSQSAQRDLGRIEEYLNDYTINKVIKKINEDIENLKFMPRMHKTLYFSQDKEGEYRRILSGRYSIIYKIEEDTIIILRIFNQKENYLNQNQFILKEKSIKYKIKK